jgi:hypothetical protein
LSSRSYYFSLLSLIYSFIFFFLSFYLVLHVLMRHAQQQKGKSGSNKEQEVLGRINRLLYFDTTRTA